VGDLVVGEAKWPASREPVRVVPGVVAILLRRRPVVAQAVGLDHEAQFGPDEIDAVSVEHALGLRNGQARPPYEAEKAPLQLAVGQAEGAAVEEGT
jgi:hypothetical protein